MMSLLFVVMSFVVVKKAVKRTPINKTHMYTYSHTWTSARPEVWQLVYYILKLIFSTRQRLMLEWIGGKSSDNIKLSWNNQ